ncbi:BrnA antitoxin family protein [Massilia consociata]|uniref:BrnA antitoxin family protein n=1 Tax=Massilia consociata TaxID=760117 RepID=A0ABV6FFJ6_9BURK
MNTESILPAAQVAAPARRARPPKRKTRITIYLDDEVLDEFRSLSERCGTGYQTLINAALRNRLAAPATEGSLA